MELGLSMISIQKNMQDNVRLYDMINPLPPLDWYRKGVFLLEFHIFCLLALQHMQSLPAIYYHKVFVTKFSSPINQFIGPSSLRCHVQYHYLICDTIAYLDKINQMKGQNRRFWPGMRQTGVRGCSPLIFYERDNYWLTSYPLTITNHPNKPFHTILTCLINMLFII